MRFKIVRDDLIRLTLSYLRLNVNPEEVVLTNRDTNPVFVNKSLYIDVKSSAHRLNVGEWKKKNLKRVQGYLLIDIEKFQDLINHMINTKSIHLHEGKYELTND